MKHPFEHLNLTEALHPDLVPYVFKTESGFDMIAHPLMQTPLTFPALINERYQHVVQAVDEAREGGNWKSYVFIHARPYRAEALDELVADGSLDLEDKATWELIHDVWIDSENVQQYDEFWQGIWHCENTQLGMSDEEVEAFHILPDRIPIWHGMERDDPETLGFSWTTSYKVAKWFADRMALLNNRPPFLASGFVKKEHVKTYMLDRGEFEIIAFPEDVEDILIEKI